MLLPHPAHVPPLDVLEVFARRADQPVGVVHRERHRAAHVRVQRRRAVVRHDVGRVEREQRQRRPEQQRRALDEKDVNDPAASFISRSDVASGGTDRRVCMGSASANSDRNHPNLFRLSSAVQDS